GTGRPVQRDLPGLFPPRAPFLGDERPAPGRSARRRPEYRLVRRKNMERNYATQMEAARQGIVTPELETVAKKEQMRVEELLPLVAQGKVVIPANRLHTCLDPEGVGSMLRTKINVNLGVSRDCKDYD